MTPHAETPIPPPSSPYPSGLSQSTGFWYPASWINLHCSSVLHMIIFRFQCYSPNSSHPPLLPRSPKVCSLHLCLLCCPACGIIDTVFLNSLCIALGILIPQSGIKPVPPALETCSLNHSTAREVLEYYFNIEFKFNI